jgi:hypothetical protein
MLAGHAVPKNDYPTRIVILSERSESKDLSSPAAAPLPVYPSRGAVRGFALDLQTFQRATFKRSYEPFATVDSNQLTQALSPLESALTGYAQLSENTATLSGIIYLSVKYIILF